MTKRKIPTDTIPLEIPYIFDCNTVAELKYFLISLHNHLDSFLPTDIVDRNHDNEYDGDLYINRFREETDEEYNYRLEKERVAAEKKDLKTKAQKLAQQEKERKQFEKLKKKFEGV